MIERAIVQQYVIGRDGEGFTRACPRPDHVVETAHRMQRWRDVREGCQLCRAENAVSVRAGAAVCGRCKSQMEQRIAGFDAGLRVKPLTAETRASESGLTGTAIVFDSLSVDLGGFFERIAPKAVDRTIAEGSDVLALVDHDSSKPIGRLSAGTLRLRKTNAGLVNSIPDPPATTAGKDIVINVMRRDITGQSFGFRVLEDDWAMEGDVVIRTVMDMRISEVSIVTFPAYKGTSIHIGADAGGRSLESMEREHKTRLAR